MNFDSWQRMEAVPVSFSSLLAIHTHLANLAIRSIFIAKSVILQSNCLQFSSIQDCIRTLVQDEGFHLPSQEAKAALNSATSLCKWFDSDQAKDMVEEFNKALKTSLMECIQNAVQQVNGVDTQRLWSSYQGLISSEQIGHKQIVRCRNQQRILLNRTKSKVMHMTCT